MTMSSVTYVPFKLWIILNLLSFVSSNISSQHFILHNTLSISTKTSDVTKRCRIFNEQTSRNCDVGLDVIHTSVFLKKVDGKLCNFERFPLVVSIYVC